MEAEAGQSTKKETSRLAEDIKNQESTAKETESH